MTPYESYIHISRYARFRDDLDGGRRETWPETVQRAVDFLGERANQLGPRAARLWGRYRDDIHRAILQREVMPSMRLMMTAGEAARRDPTAVYNCSYLPLLDLRAFDELMYTLLCGTGVGFSVESRYVSQLPRRPTEFVESNTTIRVEDSKYGWANALRETVALLVSGRVPQFDLSRVRPKGARLKTFGGRASGPEPLKRLLDFTVSLWTKPDRRGQPLSPLEAHDLACMIGDVVVVGGVRRSAMISLSDLDSRELQYAKAGRWWEDAPQRGLANNSAVYMGKPSLEAFLTEWRALYLSGSGERGIFNRRAAELQCERHGRDSAHEWGTNPCSEIILRPFQYCNLTEVVVRPSDSYADLARKVELATVLGSLQASFTSFNYVRPQWQEHCEEEALLGVSLTGIMDHPVLSRPTAMAARTLERLRKVARRTNRAAASAFDTNIAAAITCVKPSGTVSQLVNSASGLHPRYAPYYLRRVRNDAKDPVTLFLKDAGVPWEPDALHPEETVVFTFPMRSPPGAVTLQDVTALDQLEHWLMLQRHWCEHKPSITVSVADHEWLPVAAWVYEHFDEVSGISFLPKYESTHPQMPYEAIDADTYMELAGAMPAALDWSRLRDYEEDDQTTASQELACVAGQCEL